MIIYRSVNNITGKCYIGQTTKTLQWRIKKHIINSKKSKYYFHNAIKKYGEENFTWEILCECNTKEELNEMEFHYIKQYHSHYTENGYNIELGGSNGNCLCGKDNGMYGKKHSIKAKNTISEKNKGNIPWNKGKPRSNETKRKISEKNKGNKSWCKGLTKDDPRMKSLIDKRNKTMIENNLFKKDRSHPNFKKLDEDMIIKCIKDNISLTKISKILNENRNLISRRVKLLKKEGKL